MMSIAEGLRLLLPGAWASATETPIADLSLASQLTNATWQLTQHNS